MWYYHASQTLVVLMQNVCQLVEGNVNALKGTLGIPTQDVALNARKTKTVHSTELVKMRNALIHALVLVALMQNAKL